VKYVKVYLPYVLFSLPAVTLAALFLTVSFMAGCTVSRSKQPTLALEGALLLSGETPWRVRAYQPEVHLILTWPEGETGTAEVVVDNVRAGRTSVDVRPVAGNAADCRLKVLSPTSLSVSVSGGNGRQHVRLAPPPPEYNGYTIALVGDSQGENDVLARIIAEINDTGACFLIHLGDMVPSGTPDEFRSFLATMAKLQIPWYSVPGNHDVRYDGLRFYDSNLAPSRYYFDWAGIRFLFLDSSSLGFPANNMAWLRETLAQGQDALLFMHVPPLDPRGRDHAFLDRDEARAFMDLIEQHAVRGVFSGHIHMFHQRKERGILHLTTGGAGAALYASREEGGFHHYVLLDPYSLAFTVHEVEPPPWVDGMVVSGKNGDFEFSTAELMRLASVRRHGSFENRLNNIGGRGGYLGVPVRLLLEKTGGMAETDTLLVHARDGYVQEYGYANVYPEKFGWGEIQGEMALAVTFIGQAPPEWRDGYRLVFLPGDGLYDNDDCLRTSLPGQGWHLYPSAGGRWVRKVARLEVRP
jgi:predicted phosphodiesterase